MRTLLGLLVGGQFFLAMTTCTQPRTSLDSSPAPNRSTTEIPLVFQTSNGWTYDGRIELPAAEQQRPWGVILLGGGFGTDIDWSVPGEFTIDGQPTKDASQISGALRKAGFVVMRWDAIRRGDPLHEKNPMMMERPAYSQTIEQAQVALTTFRTHRVVPADHVFLLGHSNGARRATCLMDGSPSVAGVILLSGGGLLAAKAEALDTIFGEAEELLERADRNHNGCLDAEEFETYRPVPGHEIRQPKFGFNRIDLDKSSTVDLTELAIGMFSTDPERWRKTKAQDVDRWGQPWPALTLARHHVPTLLVYGSRDERRLSGYATASLLLRSNHPDFELKVYEGMGHLLGPVQDDKTGSISPAVLRDIVRWIEKRLDKHTSSRVDAPTHLGWLIGNRFEYANNGQENAS